MKNIIPFTLEQRLLNHLILHAFQQENIGLLNGRMGTVVTLFLIGRYMREKICLNLAEKLLENIIGCLRKDAPL